MLTDLPLLGHPFTWERGRGTAAWVQERIDRAMVSDSWLSLFPQARLTNLIAAMSDHTPILIETAPRTISSRNFRFRFENSWLRESDLVLVVNSSWEESSSLDLISRLHMCTVRLERWGKELARKFKHRINSYKTDILRLQGKDDSSSVDSYARAKQNLANLPLQEEAYWKQRSKSFWLKEGDANTRFFHASTSTRKRVNEIHFLCDDNGMQFDKIGDMCHIVKDYFSNLFSENVGTYDPVLGSVVLRVTSDENELLLADFSIEEFHSA